MQVTTRAPKCSSSKCTLLLVTLSPLLLQVTTRAPSPWRRASCCTSSRRTKATAGRECAGTRTRRDTCPRPTSRSFWKPMPKVLWHTFNSASVTLYFYFLFLLFLLSLWSQNVSIHCRGNIVEIKDCLPGSSDKRITPHAHTLPVSPGRKSQSDWSIVPHDSWLIVCVCVAAHRVDCDTGNRGDKKCVWKEASSSSLHIRCSAT